MSIRHKGGQETAAGAQVSLSNEKVQKIKGGAQKINQDKSITRFQEC